MLKSHIVKDLRISTSIIKEINLEKSGRLYNGIKQRSSKSYYFPYNNKNLTNSVNLEK
jgi:hypothetical protein